MPVREKGRRSPGSQLALPFSRPSHPQTAAKVRGFSPIASRFTAETDWLVEGDGFEPSVPRKAPGVVGCRCIDRHLDDTAARVSRFNGASLPSSPPRVDYWSSQTVDKS